MTRTLTLLFGATMVIAAIDLIHKQQAISEQGGAVFLHDRPTRYVLAGAALSLGWAAAIALTRSSSIAVFGGVVLGGLALLVPAAVVYARRNRSRLFPPAPHGESLASE